jgi:hypothetical protein
METQAPHAEPATNVVLLHPTDTPGPTFEELAAQAFQIAVGLASAVAAVLTEALARTIGHEPIDEEPAGDEEMPQPSGVPLLAGAAFGLALEGGRWAFRTAGAVAKSGRPWLSFVMSPNVVRRRLDDAQTFLRTLDDRWREEQPRGEEAATSFVHALVPEIVNAALDQIDLTELVVEHVDLDRILARVDLNAVIERVDIGRILERIDLNDVIERVDLDRIVRGIDVQAIVDRIPLDAVVARVDLNQVAARIDVDEIVAKVDVEAIVQRIDVVGLAREVIDEIDLPAIIRESSGAMAGETVEGIRLQSMDADRLVARVVDKVLRRRARDTDAPEEPSSSLAQPPIDATDGEEES